MSVHLEWVGMACFRLWRDGGDAIAMDPYTPSAIGLVDDGISYPGRYGHSQFASGHRPRKCRTD